MNTHELEHLLELRRTHQTRLEVLELQAAKYGISTPAHIAVEIKSIKAEISAINQHLETQQGIESAEETQFAFAPPDKLDRETLIRLRNLLSNLYEDENKARRVIYDAGINESLISFEGSAKQMWHGILLESEKQQKLSRLLLVAQSDYRDNNELKAIWNDYQAMSPQN